MHTRRGAARSGGAIRLLLCGSMTLLLGAAPYPRCACDCDRNGVVTVDELVRGIRIALDLVPVTECAAIDANGDKQATIDEVIIGVDAVLEGCVAAAPTPSPSAFFTDVTRAAGLEYVQYEVPPTPLFSDAEFFTGGAAVGDYDRDGHPDLYVTRLTGAGILFRNQGDGSFVDVTTASGLDAIAAASNGAAWVDIDNDGDLDLYVTGYSADAGRNFLFINDGSGHFSEAARERGVAAESAAPHYGTSVAVGDYDRDGWVDLHVTGLVPERGVAPSQARLFHNRGGGWFEDVTDSAGVTLGFVSPFIPRPFGVLSFASAFSDVDNDGWPDLLVASDYRTSRLFWNNHDGTFSDGTAAAQVATDENGMGSTIADYDGDGLLDWFVTSIYDAGDSGYSSEGRWGNTGNRLYRNRGDRTFVDATDEAGVRRGDWGWGAAFFDYDNDGRMDLVMTNGVEFPFLADLGLDGLIGPFRHDPMRLWRGTSGGFLEVSAESGLTDRGPGKGLVVFDYDSDGDLDIFIVHNSGTPLLYRNDLGAPNGWLRVDVVGTDSNSIGIGARVWVTAVQGELPAVREIGSSSHFLGQGEATAHFGLGSGDQPVAEVRVEWPKSGRQQVLRNVARNQRLLVSERDD